MVMKFGAFFQTVTDIGGISGLILGIKYLISYFNQPRIKVLSLDPERDIRIYTYARKGWRRKFVNLHVENNKKCPAISAVATLELLSVPPGIQRHFERIYYLHWADVPYSSKSKRPEPVEIYKGEMRLDIAFTCSDQRTPGCWIAIPLALRYPMDHQAYLPPGEYKIEIDIYCKNGRGAKRSYKIISPDIWEDLNMVEL